MTLPCLVCNKKLEPAFDDDVDTNQQPYEATVFTSHGQYGSTVFDEIDGTFLEINICDNCLTHAARYRKVLIGTPQRQVVNVNYEQWNPPPRD